MCLKYPGTRYIIGRAVLTALKQSTLLTFFEAANNLGLKRDIDYEYRDHNGTITFIQSGSVVFLKDLADQPSDPEFDDLGSREYTAGFIDEASQISNKCYNIIKSRIRFKLEEFNLIPKLLICSNPTKNFLYYDFFKPWKDKKLIDYKYFLPALVQDNPFISPHYITNLEKLDKISKERLLYGNWEYDDTDDKIFEYDKIIEMFTSLSAGGAYYLSCDVARFGSDLSVFMVWRGLNVEKIYAYRKKSITELSERFKQIIAQHGIPIENTVIDEDGVGGGLVDMNRGAFGFVNNSRALERKQDISPKDNTWQLPRRHNFANLKTQCYIKLSEYVNQKKIGIYEEINPKVKEMLIQDLEQVRLKDMDKDGRIQLVSKDKIKERLGRSPDFSDSLMMRMVFEIRQNKGGYLS